MDNCIDLGEYYARKLDEGLFNDMIYLYKGAFNTIITAHELRKRHLNCHGNNKYVGFIAYYKETNEPAAYYGVFPTYMVYNGKQFLAAQSGDTMTHPKHQKKGLFVQLARVTYNYCREVGIKLIFGFPNENSYPGFMKHLGFTEMHRLNNIQLYQNRFELNRFFASSQKWKDRHTLFVKKVLFVLFKAGQVFQNSNQYDSTITYVEHDTIYALQKESSDKFCIYINGCNVFLKIINGAIIIGDIDSNNEFKVKSVISKLKFITWLTGYRFLVTGLSNNAFLSKYLLPLATQVSNGNRVILLDLDGDIPFASIAFLNSDIDVF